jgi:regulator of sigma D
MKWSDVYTQIDLQIDVYLPRLCDKTQALMKWSDVYTQIDVYLPRLCDKTQALMKWSDAYTQIVSTDRCLLTKHMQLWADLNRYIKDR